MKVYFPALPFSKAKAHPSSLCRTNTRISITSWYKRTECCLRLAIFYSSATAAGAFGGLLARAIMEMKGVGGKSGWSWIFIIEGLVTLVVALGAYYFMHDYLETATFLTEPERKEVKRRLEQDSDFLANEYNQKFVWQALTDWKIHVFSLLSAGMALPCYSVSLFLPTIVKSLGCKNTTAQLMTTPPYLVACVLCIASTSIVYSCTKKELLTHNRRVCPR
jgi:MFS family permease